MAVTVNQRIRAEEGRDGTIVIVSAWCDKCRQDSMPMNDFTCAFCGSLIVDEDELSARELRAQIAGEPEPEHHSNVIPIPKPAAPVPERAVALRADSAKALTQSVPPVSSEPRLQIAKGFSLPIDVAGEATAILAKRGAGKTNTGRVLAEEYFAAGVQIVVLDPIGVWWGLRAHADGVQAGLPIPILGGDHGDADLGMWQGALTAQVIVGSGMSVVLDLSEMSKDGQRTFAADFAEELYRIKGHDQTQLHVFFEESDEFAPQKARAGGDPEERSRMRGAVETLARRGRSRGIGMTVITQRSASLSKDVLTQADTLVAMRTTGPTDVAAIKEWVRHHGEQGDMVVKSLSGLKTGEAWVWSPEREVLARVQIRLAWTFDSSSTPKFGQPRRIPEVWAPVELPLALGEETEPPPAYDYRSQDDDGLWGCKEDGCEGRARSRSGPYAYLCDEHSGRLSLQPGAPVEQPEPGMCKIAGCGEPALFKTGTYARLCEGHRADRRAELGLPPSREFGWTPEDEDPVSPEPKHELVVREPPLTHDGVQLFGLTGDFARDAERVRSEAERIRGQADELDQIAESLDRLAGMQT